MRRNSRGSFADTAGSMGSKGTPAIVAIPDNEGRNAVGHTPGEQDALGVAVLRDAFYRLAREWATPVDLARLGNTPERPRLGLAQSLAPKTELGIDSWYAQRLLQRVEFNLSGFESHPYRTRADVLWLVRTAIRIAGHEPPSMPVEVRVPRRGGWALSSGAQR